ncbi:MAG: type II/IV secretion system protein, partial [Pirellulales bacterium]|nr:type II/IV secretion system protein [Pirellulales bacterium]
MVSKSADFTEILIRQRVISSNQLAEAQHLARSANTKVGDALVRLGYATPDEVMRAIAEEHGLEFVDLSEAAIPPHVVELVPESVARENAILPLAEEEDGSLKVVVSDPLDFETLDKLRFILNRKVEIALAPRESIVDAISRNYGLSEGESADSMLQEFTDTAIDFTETEDITGQTQEQIDENAAPIVRLVHLLITEAVQLRASDIHIEPFENR